MFQHNEFHAWSAANHAKVITGTQITAASRVKMNVSADLLRRLPTESMTQLCHVVADVKLKNKKKKEKKRKKEKKVHLSALFISRDSISSIDRIYRIYLWVCMFW